MIDRDKVIKGLEEVVHDFHEEVDEWSDFTPDELRGGITVDCDWFYGVLEKCEAAIALLEAQKPRVMALDEIKFVYGSPYIIETRESNGDFWIGYCLFLHTGIKGNYDFVSAIERKRLMNIDYGRTWRCWTEPPTYTQREATPWA